jgi:hypothetical protein
MSHKEGAYLGGIRSVEDLRQRCRVDEDTGCWHWGLCRTPQGYARVYFVMNGKAYTAAARRAAVMLSTGEELRRGHVAFAQKVCQTPIDCANPEHSRASTRSNHGSYIATTGRYKTVRHAAASRATIRRCRAKITLEDARAIRASDELYRVLAERYGVSEKHICEIRRGKVWKEHATAANAFTYLVEQAKRAA